MKRGDIYRVAKPPGHDPKQHRYFVVVSRDALITSKFSAAQLGYSALAAMTRVAQLRWQKVG